MSCRRRKRRHNMVKVEVKSSGRASELPAEARRHPWHQASHREELQWINITPSLSHCSHLWSEIAMAAVMATPEITTAKGTAPNPSRNPLPLSASQESQVRELYYKRVRQKCADEVRGMLYPSSQYISSPY